MNSTGSSSRRVGNYEEITLDFQTERYQDYLRTDDRNKEQYLQDNVSSLNQIGSSAYPNNSENSSQDSQFSFSHGTGEKGMSDIATRIQRETNEFQGIVDEKKREKQLRDVQMKYIDNYDEDYTKKDRFTMSSSIQTEKDKPSQSIAINSSYLEAEQSQRERGYAFPQDIHYGELNYSAKQEREKEKEKVRQELYSSMSDNNSPIKDSPIKEQYSRTSPQNKNKYGGQFMKRAGVDMNRGSSLVENEVRREGLGDTSGGWMVEKRSQERQIERLNGEVERLNQLLRMQSLSMKEREVELEIEAQKKDKNTQLQMLLQQIKTIDVHTEEVFAEKLEAERIEKEQALEKTYQMADQIRELEGNCQYYKDLAYQAQDEKEILREEYEEQIKQNLDFSETRLAEECQRLKTECNNRGKELISVESFYKNQLEEIKQIYEASLAKTKNITDEFERLLQESDRNKELLSNCQKQLRQKEIQVGKLEEEKGRLSEDIVTLRKQIVSLQDSFKDQDKQQNDEINFHRNDNNALLNEVNYLRNQNNALKIANEGLQREKNSITNEAREAVDCLEQQLKEIERLGGIEDEVHRLRGVEEELKRLMVEGKIQGEKIDEMKGLNEQQSEEIWNLREQLQGMQIDYEEKRKESEMLKSELSEMMGRNEQSEEKRVLKEKNRELEIQLDSSLKDQAVVQSENQRLQEKVNRIQADNFLQLQDFQNQLNHYYLNLLEKQDGENSRENERELQEEQIAQLRKQICDLESELSLTKLERSRLMRDIAEKNDEIETLFSRLKDIEKQRFQFNQRLQRDYSKSPSGLSNISL